MTYADLAQRHPSRTETWASPDFEAELAEWVSAQVGELRELVPYKHRVWATVWIAETAERRFFVKQNCHLQSFEAALVAELASLAPDRVVPVTAHDAVRGLLLTPEQGPVLGSSVSDDDVDTWCRVVAAGAALQREVAPYADRLAALGVSRLAPEDAVGYTEQRLVELGGLAGDDPRRLPPDEADVLRGHLPAVRLWAEQVAALGLPVTLNHNDLHDNNVFLVGGDLRFFDFADSLLTEPLGALLIPLNMLSHRLEAGPDDPRLWKVADAALEVWSDLADIEDLRAALPVALQLARLGRAESWARCCASMSDPELDEWGGTVAKWLSTLLLDPPVGRVTVPAAD